MPTLRIRLPMSMATTVPCMLGAAPGLMATPQTVRMGASSLEAIPYYVLESRKAVGLPGATLNPPSLFARLKRKEAGLMTTPSLPPLLE